MTTKKGNMFAAFADEDEAEPQQQQKQAAPKKPQAPKP